MNPKLTSYTYSSSFGGVNPFALTVASVTGIPPTYDPSNDDDKELKASLAFSPSGTVTLPST